MTKTNAGPQEQTETKAGRPVRPVRLVAGRIEGPDLLTIREVAALFGIRRETVWAWRRVYGFPVGLVIGTSVRFPREAVERWMDARAARARNTGAEAGA